MSRPEIDKGRVMSLLGSCGRSLGASRIVTDDSVLMVYMGGLGQTKGESEKARLLVGEAAESCGVPGIYIPSSVRHDSGLYRKLVDEVVDVLGHDACEGALGYQRMFGFHMSLPKPLGLGETAGLADRLLKVMVDTVGEGGSSRFIITTPLGYAFREHGVSVDSVLCGLVEPPEDAEEVVRVVRPVFTMEDLCDFCILLHTSPKDMDALQLIGRLDTVGGRC